MANKNQFIGSVTQPTTLSSTTKLDIDTNKTIVDDLVYFGTNGGINVAEIEKFTSIANSRDQIYTTIDTMAKDSAVAAVLKTYADSACEAADNGHVIWCESQDPQVSKFINYVLNVINVDKQMYGWAYCLAKYGDVYLRLYRESDYDDQVFNKANVDAALGAKSVLTEGLKENVTLNTHSANDKYSLYVEMVPDPGTMFDVMRMGMTYGYIETPNVETNTFDFSTLTNGQQDMAYANYKLKSNDVNLYQADDFVHGCLGDSYSRFPEKVELYMTGRDYNRGKNAKTYSVKRGKSMLIDNYKVWREKTLLENAILLNRVTRSSIVRKIGVEVGDMPKEQVTATLRRVKDLFEQKSAYDAGNSFSEYNNPGPIENNVYFATHNGQGAITVEAVGGDVDVKGLADLDSWVNKFYSGFGVPKAYYGWTEDGAGFNGGTSLSIISSVFAKGVKHLQDALIQMVTDMINLILINRGLKSYINRFVLKMQEPLTQEAVSYREDFSNRINAISSMNSLFSDVEDKARRLTILKGLVTTLNCGDSVIAVLDEEIQAVKEQAKKDAEAEAAAKAAEEAAAKAADIGDSDHDLQRIDVPTEIEEPEQQAEPEAGDSADIDLGTADVPNVTEESLDAQQVLNERIDLLVSDDLPTAEELHQDLTENK